MHDTNHSFPAARHAVVCHAYGAPPQLDYHRQETGTTLAEDSVQLEVHRAAFNFTDHLMLQGRYQDKPALPFIPGLDAAGVVQSVGTAVHGLKRGDRVIASGVVGAWSTHLIAPAQRLVKIPDGVDSADAVASINSHLTAYHGLIDRAELSAGQRVLVLGANGSVGQAACQIARHHGAEVFALTRDGLKLRLDGPTGPQHLAPEELKQGLRNRLGARGADIVVDPLGDHYTDAAVRNLAWRGRLLVIGFAGGEIPRLATNLLLLKGVTVMGVYCGGLLMKESPAFTSQLAAMLALMERGVLTPTPHLTLPADDVHGLWTRFSTAPRGTKVLLGFKP